MLATFRISLPLINTPFAGEIRDMPCVLYVPVLHPCMLNEKLCIAVNIQKGTFLVSLSLQRKSVTTTVSYCVFHLETFTVQINEKVALFITG